MRTYFASLEDCSKYMEDKNHKVCAWKEEYSFKLKNSTQYILEVKRSKPFMFIVATVEPGKSVKFFCNCHDDWEISVKGNLKQKCSFHMDKGNMVSRNSVTPMENDKEYIAPIFKNSTVTIVTCKDCSPNFGVIPKYKIRPIEFPARKVTIANHTRYNLIISYGDEEIQRIESRKTEEIGIPISGVIYVDTETEEVKFQDEYTSKEEIITRVNGCCIEIKNGTYYSSVDMLGPGNWEPYIQYLWATGDSEEISIWHAYIDERE